jgi:small-conductance mechanosensitive channel
MAIADVGDYNVNAQFRVWIDDETPHIPLRFELSERLFEAFRAASIDMPLQTIQLAPIELVQTAFR